VCCYAADEESPGFLVQNGRPAQEARQQGTERRDGDEPAIIFYEKLSAEIGVAALHPDASLTDLEIAIHVVVTQTPSTPVIGLGAHLAQGLEHFEQADIIPPIPLHERE
jgi:hypothetical protein